MSDSGRAIPEHMQLRTVEMPTSDGVIRGKVAITRGPMKLTGLVSTACALTDALVARAIRQEEDAGRSISCRAGCGACCRHMVPLSPPEAFALMDTIEALDPDRKRDVLERFDAIVANLEQHGMIAELLDPPPSDEPVLPIARRYFELQQACPFLVDESCSIHPHRPVACRDYNVTAPADLCSQPYEHDVAKVPLPLPLSVPLSRLTAKLTDQPPRLIPLTLVPRWTAEHTELHNRTWPGPELFDHFLAEIGASGASDNKDSLHATMY